MEILDYDKEQREKAAAEAANGNDGKAGQGSRKRSREEKRAKKREKKEKKRERKKMRREKKRLKQAKEDGQQNAGRVGAEQSKRREARRSMELPPEGSRGRESSTTYRRSDCKEVVGFRGRERIRHRDYDRYGERRVGREGGMVPSGGSGQAEERGSFSSIHRRSRSPFERKEGWRGRGNSSKRNDRRHPEVRPGLGDSRSGRGRNREDERMQERGARARNRSESSGSSSFSSSPSSSSRSNSEGGNSSGSNGSNMATKARRQNRSVSATRGRIHESGRDKRERTHGAHNGRSRSRSAQRQNERNREREKLTRYEDPHFDGRRRHHEGRRGRSDGGGRRY